MSSTGGSKKEKSSSAAGHLKYVVVAAVLGYLIRYYIGSSWHFQVPLDHANFDYVAPYNRIEIPTTYYKSGKLHEILPKWHPEGGSYIHLYRLAPGEKFNFDMSQVNGMSVVSRKMAFENCTRLESNLCASCEAHKEHRDLTVGEIMSRKYGPDYFSSFTKMKEADMHKKENLGLKVTSTVASTTIAENIYDKLFPSFQEKKYELIHAFVSNFDRSRVSTSVHCNALATSAAIQLVGSKSWLFYPPQVYLDKMHSKPAKLSHFPTTSPDSPYDLYVYTSQPGDVLFFTNNWAHSVYSHEGPNYMINYRKLPELSNVLPNPLAYFHMLGYFLLAPGLETSADINAKAKLLTSLACEGRLSKWDQQMVDLLHAEKSGANNA